MLKNFSSHFDLKALLNAFHKWSPLFQWTWTRLNFPLQKGLPWCMAGYETWFTGATLIEIGVYAYLAVRKEVSHSDWSFACKLKTNPRTLLGYN